jgi:PKD domain
MWAGPNVFGGSVLARGLFFCCAAFAACMAATAAPAEALITDAQTIDGPSGAVLDLGGVAMSEDGTGGVVYRKLEGGRAQVYAAQFFDGRWRQPRRVDVGQDFDSYWPRIAAGDRGRLVVTWAEEFGQGIDRMYSATLDPGASRFQRPIPIDFNVGEAIATFPSLAMNRGGTAYLAYRVVSFAGGLPPGYVNSDIRVARYSAPLWRVIGTPADRNSAVPTREPSAENSPKIGVDLNQNAIIAFHEPDDEFVDRVWARRIFGTTYGNPLIVSPRQHEGQPLRGPADAFDLDVAGFGQGVVALRQQPGEGSRLPGTRIFVNSIPESTSEAAAQFGGPRLLEAAGGTPGVPSVGASPTGTFMAGFGVGNASLSVEGDDSSTQRPERLDGARSSIPGDPQVEFAESTAAAAAWRESIGRRGQVSILERRDDGVPEVKPVRASGGGPVGAVDLAASSLGDAIVGFQQGASGSGQIAVAVVDAPPARFLVFAPDTWIRRKRTGVTWDRVATAVSPVTYTVAVDDEPVRGNLRGTHVRLGPRHLPEGRHRLEIVATDRADQETVSSATRVRVDRRRPRVRIRRRGRLVSVRVTDRRPGSGLRRRATRVRFGDGSAARRSSRARHRYASRGRYVVTVTARDRAGNRIRFRRAVRVR